MFEKLKTLIERFFVCKNNKVLSSCCDDLSYTQVVHIYKCDSCSQIRIIPPDEHPKLTDIFNVL